MVKTKTIPSEIIVDLEEDEKREAATIANELMSQARLINLAFGTANLVSKEEFVSKFKDVSTMKANYDKWFTKVSEQVKNIK
jgi:hypothetical protein